MGFDVDGDDDSNNSSNNDDNDNNDNSNLSHTVVDDKRAFSCTGIRWYGHVHTSAAR
jgi:hypothetical protein